MPVELELRLEKVSSSDLVEVYRSLCEVFGIKYLERDARHIEKNGLYDLREIGSFDHNPYFGGKFFVRVIGNQIIFNGYNQREDINDESKEKRFKKLLIKYFNHKD